MAIEIYRIKTHREELTHGALEDRAGFAAFLIKR